MSILLEARGLVCGYGDKPITAPIDLSLEAGQILALIGPNGSGKSTMLKTLAGQLRPLHGTVRVNGESLSGLTEFEVAQRVAIVPQDEAYSFRFSVHQIVGMGRLARSGGFFETREDHQAISQALEKADCAFFQDRPITEISGGERQRTLIARALAQETPVLVMDEPTSHLDVSHVAEFVRLARTLAADGKSVILAVHDINVALAAADTIVLIQSGKQRFAGSPEQLVISKEAEAVYGVRFLVHENEGTFTLAAMLQ